MVYKRVCRDCPIEGCGARYLARLSNHLADVHELHDPTERKKYLQEAKLQPKVKFIVYHATSDSRRGDIAQNESAIEQCIYERSRPREGKVSSYKKKQKNKRRQRR